MPCFLCLTQPALLLACWLLSLTLSCADYLECYSSQDLTPRHGWESGTSVQSAPTLKLVYPPHSLQLKVVFSSLQRLVSASVSRAGVYRAEAERGRRVGEQEHPEKNRGAQAHLIKMLTCFNSSILEFTEKRDASPKAKPGAYGHMPPAAGSGTSGTERECHLNMPQLSPPRKRKARYSPHHNKASLTGENRFTCFLH